VDIVGTIGAVTGCVSLIGLIYLFGVWRGKVDTSLHAVQDSIKNYPPAEMWTMVKTLWDIYVVSALHGRPDLAQHGSGYKLKQEGEDLIPDNIKTLLSLIPNNPYNSEAIATGYLVVKHIGMDLINDMAQQKALSVQEAIAILSCWFDVHSNTNHPVA